MMIRGSLTSLLLFSSLFELQTCAFQPSRSVFPVIPSSSTFVIGLRNDIGQHQSSETKRMAYQRRRNRIKVLDPPNDDLNDDHDNDLESSSARSPNNNRMMATTRTLATTTTAFWSLSSAEALAQSIDMRSLSSINMTPETFQPVCGVSDGFYRVLQQSSISLIGMENYDQYKPLIAGGLLRVRLELCVVESFLNEAVVPFIRDNGVSWVLPLHETVETFIAGVIFCFATTFVLIGSTKIVTVVITYTDFLLGLPARLLGGFAFDRAQSKPVTFDLGIGPFKTRVVGPTEEELKELKPLDITKQSIPTVIVLVFSGAINYFGQGLGVRFYTTTKH